MLPGPPREGREKKSKGREGGMGEGREGKGEKGEEGRGRGPQVKKNDPPSSDGWLRAYLSLTYLLADVKFSNHGHKRYTKLK